MRRTARLAALILTAALLATLPAAAQSPGETIRSVIDSQIDAFRTDDMDTAFGFASPGIQGMFGSPERFGQMVEQGYPMVWRPADVTYLDLRETGGRMWQDVLIRDRSGRVHKLEYQMIPGADGGWKINGVRILELPEIGA